MHLCTIHNHTMYITVCAGLHHGKHFTPASVMTIGSAHCEVVGVERPFTQRSVLRECGGHNSRLTCSIHLSTRPRFGCRMDGRYRYVPYSPGSFPPASQPSAAVEPQTVGRCDVVIAESLLLAVPTRTSDSTSPHHAPIPSRLQSRPLVHCIATLRLVVAIRVIDHLPTTVTAFRGFVSLP